MCSAKTDNTNFDILYDQANNHLLETDRKRDQIFVIYFTVTSIYFAFVQEFTESIITIYSISILLILLGIIFSLLIIEYRKWHIKYSLACIVIQKLTYYEKGDINQKKITKILRDEVKETTPNKFFKSVETLVFNVYLLIESACIIILVAYGNLNLIAALVICISIIIFLNHYHYKEIKNLCSKQKILSSDIWIINLFEKEERLQEDAVCKEVKSSSTVS